MPEPRWLDERQRRAWRGYLSVQARLAARLNRELQRDASISLADFDVLVALSDRTGRQVRVLELADALSWEKSRLSHQLTRMERRDLVAREDCPDDGRGAFVVLTRHGRAVLDAAAPAHVETVRALVFDGLDAAQLDALVTVAEGVLDRLQRPVPEAVVGPGPGGGSTPDGGPGGEIGPDPGPASSGARRGAASRRRVTPGGPGAPRSARRGSP